jgi:hypothetical protein
LSAQAEGGRLDPSCSKCSHKGDRGHRGVLHKKTIGLSVTDRSLRTDSLISLDAFTTQFIKQSAALGGWGLHAAFRRTCVIRELCNSRQAQPEGRTDTLHGFANEWTICMPIGYPYRLFSFSTELAMSLVVPNGTDYQM